MSSIDPRSATYKSAGVDQDRKDRAVEEAIAGAAKTFRAGVISNPGGFAACSLSGNIASPCSSRAPTASGPSSSSRRSWGGTTRSGSTRRHERQRPHRAGRGALVLPRLHRHGARRARAREGADRGRDRGLPALGVRAPRRRDAREPGIYAGEEYDLAGFAVGVVERDAVIDGARVEAGDALVGIASSGVHSNGYSLCARSSSRTRACRSMRAPLAPRTDARQALLEPTRIYAPRCARCSPDFARREELRAPRAHHRRGIPGNLPRVLPPGIGARVRLGSWPIPPVPRAPPRARQDRTTEMFDVYNMGVGLTPSFPRFSLSHGRLPGGRRGEGIRDRETSAGNSEVEIV